MGHLISEIKKLINPESVRQNGIRSIIIRALEITEICRRSVLIDRDLNEPIPNFSAKVPIDIALLKADEVEELAAFCERNYQTLRSPEIRSRLNSGHLCFVARYNGRIVHASWAAFHVFDLRYLRLLYRLQPDEVYLYDMHTESEFRGQHIARERISWTFRYLRDAGYKRIVTEALPDNIVSLYTSEPFGFRSLGLLTRIILGPLKITLYSPGVVWGH